MSDDATKFEQQKSQFVAGLTAVAESMRKCAEMAEAFAVLVNGSAASVESPAAHEKALTGKRKRKADATEEGEGPKRRKRKPKDPNAPKRPASSYILFQNEVRKELKALHPSMSNHELLNMIAKQWQEMSEEDKAVYHQAMTTAKERYSQDKKAYDNRTPEEIQAANAAVAAAAAMKKPRKSAKAAGPAEERHRVPVMAVAAEKPVVGDASPGTDTSDGSASDESDEDGREEHDDEHDSSSSEDEKADRRRVVTRVTVQNKKANKANV